MKPMLTLFTVLLFITACTKDEQDSRPPDSAPQMQYTDLKDTSIYFNKSARFDMDGDGTKDVYFTTMPVGDPILKQDEHQWLVGTSFYTSLPVNEMEEIPVMKALDSIPVRGFSGYEWYNASTILLAQKVLKDNAPPSWEGSWKTADHRYIPFQVMRGNKRYNGWVVVSFNLSEEKLVLHKAAISKEAEKGIRAGN